MEKTIKDHYSARLQADYTCFPEYHYIYSFAAFFFLSILSICWLVALETAYNGN